MVIDVHAHYYPSEYLRRIGRPELPPRAAAALSGQGVDERLELLDEVGVDSQVLSLSHAQPYLPAAPDAAEAASLANDLYVDLCARYPGRFFSFAALPLPHVEESLAELARAMEERCVVGVTIGCSVAGLQLDDPVLDPVYEELNRRSTVVFLHPVGQESTPWLAGHNLAWLVGAPFEDTAAALRLVSGGVLERYPAIHFVVPHLGGALPFLLERIAAKSDDRITEGLRSLHYDTVSGSAAALSCSCQVFGPERLLFGTDYPYCDEAQFARHLRYLDEAGLEPAQLDGIRGASASELLSIGARLEKGA